jgi:hypothetical protein
MIDTGVRSSPDGRTDSEIRGPLAASLLAPLAAWSLNVFQWQRYCHESDRHDVFQWQRYWVLMHVAAAFRLQKIWFAQDF